MLDFEIKRSERRCSKTDRELVAGDVFYSVLIQTSEGETKREDIYEGAWEGPPEDCVGWWKTQVPSLASLRMKWAPNDVMLHYFDSLTDVPDKQDLRFVLSLLLLRRKILTQRESIQLLRQDETEDQTSDDETDTEAKDKDSTAGQLAEELQFYCPRNQKEYSVVAVDIAASRIAKIQDELAELLYSPGG